jgi:hypothetical protein
MATPQHIIRRQIVDLELAGLSQASAIQEKINRLCKNQLQPALERLFQQYASGDTVIRLERIEVDLGEVELAKLDTHFTEQVLLQLTKELNGVMMPVSSSGRDTLLSREPVHLSPQDTVLQLFIYFLKKGHFPWWAKDRSLSVLENEIKTVLSTHTREILQAVTTQDARALRRLIIQFTDDLLISIAELFEPEQEIRMLLRWLQWACPHTGTDKLDGEELRVSYWVYAMTTFAGLNGGPRLPFQFVSGAIHAVASDQRISATEFFSILAAARSAATRSSHERQQDDHNDIALSPGLAGVIDEVLVRGLSGSGVDADKIVPDVRAVLASKVGGLEGDHSKVTGNVRSGNLKMPEERDLAGTSYHKKESTGDSWKKKSEEEDTDIYIPYAGIVLIHPFLLTLFRELDLIDKNIFKDERSRHKAVTALAYAGSSDTEIPEHHLGLHKLLCGMPIEEPLRRTDEISETEAEKIEALLLAVIGHWQALKSTSPEGLRQTFLQRDGKLSPTEHGWHLHVAQKGYDILMGKLPWGISMIRLPWMKSMLQVDWT